MWRASRVLLAAGTDAALWLMRPSSRPTSLSTSGLALRCWMPSRTPGCVAAPSHRQLLPFSFPVSSLLSSPPRSSAGAGPLGARAGRLPGRLLAWGGPFGGLAPLEVALSLRLAPLSRCLLGDGFCLSHIASAIVSRLATDQLLRSKAHEPVVAGVRASLPSVASHDSSPPTCSVAYEDVTSHLRRSWPLRFLPCPRWVLFKAPRRCRRSASP